MAEFDVGWHISSFSGANGCVEVWKNGEVVHVRHSKDRQGSVLNFNVQEWVAFVAGVRNGEFDIIDIVG